MTESRTGITGSTQVAVVIGHPIVHSLSPIIHNAAYASMGLDWVYVAHDITPGSVPDALHAMRTFGLVGMNVTMPHKSDAARHVDELAGDAERLSSVNCVVPEGGRLVGHSTDGDGFVDSLRLDEGVEPSGMRIAVIGAGGAARSIIAALARAGSDIVVVNRSAANATQAASLAGERGVVGDRRSLRTVDMVVNATPVGMSGDSVLPCDPASLAPHAIVAELVYHPNVTPLMSVAAAVGLRTISGLGMLIHQAARSIAMWSGDHPPTEVMWSAARAHLEATTDTA